MFQIAADREPRATGQIAPRGKAFAHAPVAVRPHLARKRTRVSVPPPQDEDLDTGRQPACR